MRRTAIQPDCVNVSPGCVMGQLMLLSYNSARVSVCENCTCENCTITYARDRDRDHKRGIARRAADFLDRFDRLGLFCDPPLIYYLYTLQNDSDIIVVN